MKKKKILIFTNSLWNITNFRISLIKKLLNSNHKVIIVGPLSEEKIFLEKLGCEVKKINIDRKGMNPLIETFCFLKILLIIFYLRPNLILSFTIKPNIYASIASFFFSIPNIITITGLGSSLLKQSFKRKIVMVLINFSCKCTNIVFFQNNHDKDFFIEKIIKRKIKNVVVPGSGINLRKFFYDINFKNRTKEKLTFLMISRILKDKGVYEYISAAKKIKKKYSYVDFNFIGPFDYENPSYIPKKKFIDLISQSGVNYIGFKDEVIKDIIDSDVVVLPSYREGLPRSLLEAQAIGRPIIASNVPGCLDLVDENKNGYLCKVKDKNDLFDKIEKMIKTSHQERFTMGLVGRKLVERKYDEKIVIKMYEHSINSIIG